ncbi:hypothetical protein FFLO_01136 [Filobasidium floriforme]|uniref:Uncharacterized protein n=1 Tax=Filobasidium floriforme TaxID=5210 RepID=A0A8K0NSP4_9TREE|nr:hypothetical protein FFLO_01136 [Filobasidium floriforme]
MSPTLWGLDLRQVHPAKFKSSYMWNNVYHLRRTKFIVYQLAMIFCVISESLGTAALSNYRDQAKDIARLETDGVAEWSGDYIGVASYNIFNGIFVAFVFGAAFFFDLIFPERREDKGIRRAWKWCAVATCFTTLASAIAMSVIFATRSSRISGTPEQVAYITQRLRETGSDPLNYRDNALAKASLAFLWPGWVACIAATWVLWKSDKWTVRNGPWSGSERRKREEEGCFDYPGLVQPAAGVPTNPPVTAAEVPTQMEVETSSQTTLNPAVPPTTATNADLEAGLHLKSASTSPANRLKPGQEGYDYHADKLADKGRGGGPTLRPSQVEAGVRRMGDKPRKEKVGAREK